MSVTTWCHNSQCHLAIGHCCIIGSISYHLSSNTPLPSRDVIMKNKHNKSNILSTCNLWKGVNLESCCDGVFPMSVLMMISHLLMAAEFGTRVILMITLMSSCCSFAGCTATISRPHWRWNKFEHLLHLCWIRPEVLAHLRDSIFDCVGYDITSVR